MTVAEAITRIDRLRPNQYTSAEKTAWLSALDGQIFAEIIMTHRDADRTEFEAYTDTTAELLVPAPYDEELYTDYLMMQVDKANAEFGKYDQSAVLFNNALLGFRNHYNRTHMPVGAGGFRW